MTRQNWAGLLDRASGKTFVGRHSERERFEQYLGDDQRRLLHVCGVAGIGKSALLRQFGRRADELGWRLLRLDGAALDPVASTVEHAFEPALGAAADARLLVLFDEFDAVGTLHGWMRRELFPRLPASVRLVSAARLALDPRWMEAPGWRDLIDTLRLAPLDERESLEVLERCGLDADRRAEVADFAQGLPLALRVAADLSARHPGREFDRSEAADHLQFLVEQLLDEAPSEEHRELLRLACLVRRTTEPMVADVLDTDEAPDLLRWLAQRPFVSYDRTGFYPHDLVRQLLVDEMRRFEESTRQRLIRQASAYLVEQGKTRQGSQYEKFTLDLGYLLRDDVLPDWAPREAQRYRQADHDADDAARCVELVRRFESEAAAELAEHWQARQPDGLVVFRDPEGEFAGFCHFIDLDRVDPDDDRRDPAVAVAADYLGDNPLRDGETCRICRFWMARETHQQWSGMQTRLFHHIFRQVAVSPGVALGLTVHAYPDRWLDRPDNQLVALGDFEQGGIPYVVLGRDWRTISRVDWLDAMIRATVGQAPPELTSQTTVLGRDDFHKAVRKALKHFHRADRLADNPLADTLLVHQRCDGGDTEDAVVDALRALLAESCRSLGDSGGDRRHVEILEAVFLSTTARKQRAVADDLGMAYSTLRLHLKQAVDRVVDHLWQLEEKLLSR